MKTFCVIQDDGKSYLLKAVTVFEVDKSFDAFTLEMARAIHCKRPHSFRYTETANTWWTRFEDYLPRKLRPGGIVLRKVKSV